MLLVDRAPVLPPAMKLLGGRPATYADRLFLKALVTKVVRHLSTVHELLAMVAEPMAEMRRLRTLLTEHGRFPTRRTWERRLARLPATLPAQIGCLWRHPVAVLEPWHDCVRAAAIDSTVLRAKGGVWHKKDREAGTVPRSSIDTEVGWTKSGWHLWVYGWKLHLVTAVAAVWIPLAADLTPANVADSEHAPVLLADLPRALRFLLGDTSDNDPDRHTQCAAAGVILEATKRGPHPHTDDGANVRENVVLGIMPVGRRLSGRACWARWKTHECRQRPRILRDHLRDPLGTSGTRVALKRGVFLFANIQGSTDFATMQPPETYNTMLRSFHQTAHNVLTRYTRETRLPADRLFIGQVDRDSRTITRVIRRTRHL